MTDGRRYFELPADAEVFFAPDLAHRIPTPADWRRAMEAARRVQAEKEEEQRRFVALFRPPR